MTTQLINELVLLTNKIQQNTADIQDYIRYEKLLTQGGLPSEKAQMLLKRAGFSNWSEFYNARNNVINSKKVEANIIGGLVGLGVGLLIASLFDEK